MQNNESDQEYDYSHLNILLCNDVAFNRLHHRQSRKPLITKLVVTEMQSNEVDLMGEIYKVLSSQ